MSDKKVIVHTDFLGQSLAVDDRVIIPDAHGYSGFNWGTIVKFTPKMVRVAYKSESNSRYSGEKVLDPRAVLKMGEEQLQSLMLKILKT